MDIYLAEIDLLEPLYRLNVMEKQNSRFLPVKLSEKWPKCDRYVFKVGACNLKSQMRPCDRNRPSKFDRIARTYGIQKFWKVDKSSGVGFLRMWNHRCYF